MKTNENDKILEKIDELTALHPEEEYQQEVAQEDPEELEKARKKLMLMITIKCKGTAPGIIDGQIKPMVYSMNISDCENMTQMIKKKGMFGLTGLLNKQVKNK